MLRSLLAVAAGGAAGTGLRLAVDLALPAPAGALAVSTLLVNVLGSFLLGLISARVLARPRVAEWLRAGLTAGLLGSFTTFSALALSLARHLVAGDVLLAAAEAGLSMLLGVGAALVGLWCGRRR